MEASVFEDGSKISHLHSLTQYENVFRIGWHVICCNLGGSTSQRSNADHRMARF